MTKDLNTLIAETEALLVGLKKQAAELQGHPHVFVPDSINPGDKLFLVKQSPYGDFYLDDSEPSKEDIEDWDINYMGFDCAFRTKEAAEAEADAQNVRMLYRVQPGACAYATNTKWSIFVYDDGSITIERGLLPSSCILPGCFETKEQAEAALAVVGEEATRKAAFHLAGKV